MKKTNIEPYIATYLHQKGRKLGLPIAGNFELTARCNFRCPMCYVHMDADAVDAQGGELTADEWLSIAAAAQKKGMLFALLTGGEPLVRKDFFEIYDGMKKLGLMISINSNGSLLHGDVLKRFLKDPPCRFNISLYGGCDATYQKMCGIPVYNEVKENIRALRKAGVPVSLNLSITQFNCQDLEQIYRDAVELDVNVKASAYMYPPIRTNDEQYGTGTRLSAEEAAEMTVAWDKLRLTPEDFVERTKKMGQLIDDCCDSCSMETDDGVPCRAGSSSFWVTWQGKMLPCGMLTSPAVYPLESGFDAAWEELMQKTREIRMPAGCVNCSYRNVCGVCPAVCYTETGHFDCSPDYMCRKTKHQVNLMRAYEKEVSKES